MPPLKDQNIDKIFFSTQGIRRLLMAAKQYKLLQSWDLFIGRFYSCWAEIKVGLFTHFKCKLLQQVQRQEK